MKKHLTILFAVACFSAHLSAQTLVSATPLGTKTQAQLLAQFNNLPFIQFGATYYRVLYTTTDVQGMPDTASGLLVLPNNPNRVYPRLVYQHGTSGSKQDVPSINITTNGEGQLGLLFAGLGYIAVLPDYLGLGNVSRGFHPYVHAASEASAAIDMLSAVDQYCAENQIAFNEQLFVTGYSQGGHAAMALHRAIEQQPDLNLKVTAAAPMSGPYSISKVMRQLILSDDIYFYPAYIPNTALSYQTVYGNLFQNITDIFKPAYASLIDQFYQNQIPLSELNEQLIAKLIVEEGASRPFRMLQPAIVEAISNDLEHPINKALADNNTYNDWLPQAPMRLFYCMNDDQVPFANSLLARDSLLFVGAPDFQALDVMPSANHGQCVTPAVTGTLFFFLGFQQIGTVGSKEVASVAPLQLAPNPASSQVEVKNLVGDGVMELFDQQGKRQLSLPLTAGSHVLPLQTLADGLYLMRYGSNGRVWVGQLVVKH
jgi:hypothetical protein